MKIQHLISTDDNLVHYSYTNSKPLIVILTPKTTRRNSYLQFIPLKYNHIITLVHEVLFISLTPSSL